MDLTTCPECGLVAEIDERHVTGGPEGPVEHATVGCIAGHRLVASVATLASLRHATPPTFSEPPLVRVRRRRTEDD